MNERVVIDHSGWTQFRGNGVLRRLTTMMDLYASTNEEKEAPVSVAGLEDVQGVPDSAPKSDPFTDFQAQLCPSELYCCLTRNTVWYSVTIANLSPVQWQKDAIDGLVIAQDTKQTLCDLVEEHKKGSFAGSLSDFIANKGQVLLLPFQRLILWELDLTTASVDRPSCLYSTVPPVSAKRLQRVSRCV